MTRKKIIFTSGLTVTGKSTTAAYLYEHLKTHYNAALLSSAEIKHALFKEYYKQEYGVPWPPPEYYSMSNEVGNRQRMQGIEAMCSGNTEHGIKGALQLLQEGLEVVILDSTFIEKDKRDMVYEVARQLGAEVYVVDMKCDDQKERAIRFQDRARRRMRTKCRGFPELEAAEIEIYGLIQEVAELEQGLGRGLTHDTYPLLYRICYDTLQGQSHPVRIIGKRNEFTKELKNLLEASYREHQKK